MDTEVKNMKQIIQSMLTKKPHQQWWGFNLILAPPNFPGRYQPSIIGAVDFTTVFGMGTGVSPQLYTPEIFYSYIIQSLKHIKIVRRVEFLFLQPYFAPISLKLRRTLRARLRRANFSPLYWGPQRSLRRWGKSLVPGVGIEPTTRSSSGFRSTTELPRQLHKNFQLICNVKCTHL